MSAFALQTLENSNYGLVAINILANVDLSLSTIFGGRALINAIITGM